MAFNRYLYPQKATNVVQQVVLTTAWSVDGVGAANALANIDGKGITIVQSGAGANTIYTVTFDNSSTVSSVLNVKATYVSEFAPLRFQHLTVKSISTSGCVLQAHSHGTLTVASTVGAIDIAGTLCVELTCSLSAVVA